MSRWELVLFDLKFPWVHMRERGHGPVASAVAWLPLLLLGVCDDVADWWRRRDDGR